MTEANTTTGQANGLVRTVTIQKACEIATVSRRTIYNWMASGKVEFVRNAGGRVRIVESSLWQTRGATA